MAYGGGAGLVQDYGPQHGPQMQQLKQKYADEMGTPMQDLEVLPISLTTCLVNCS